MRIITIDKGEIIEKFLDGSEGKVAQQSERLVIRMFLHGMRDRGKIKQGDGIELKNIEEPVRDIVASIVVNAGYVPLLYGRKFISYHIDEEMPQEGELLKQSREYINMRKQKKSEKSTKRKLCKCKK